MTLTQEIQSYLALAPSDRDVAQGAMLLLRINRNRIIYAGALHAPRRYAPIIEAELKKHLRIRLDHQTREGIVSMEREVMPAAEQSIQEGDPVISSDAARPQSASAPHRGLRPDHDRLPRDIQQIPEQNADVYFRMKKVYNTLLQMADAAPCDRYEYLKTLKNLDDRYRAAWKKYDGYGV